MDSDADTLRKALERAFGESSDSDDEGLLCSDHLVSAQENKRPIWESVEGIKGLWLCREFLSETHQSALLSTIGREGWFTDNFHNQLTVYLQITLFKPAEHLSTGESRFKAMRFGDLPEWATVLARLVREAVCFGEVSFKRGKDLIAEDQCTEEPCPLAFDLLWREPLFDQLIVNVYEQGEGICAHVDLMRFEDGIAIISMESACVMHFSRSEEGANTAEGSCTRIPVFLNPGSLILMSGEARYLWKHEINRKPGFQLCEGKEINQQRRTSVTLRKLSHTQPKLK